MPSARDFRLRSRSSAACAWPPAVPAARPPLTGGLAGFSVQAATPRPAAAPGRRGKRERRAWPASRGRPARRAAWRGRTVAPKQATAAAPPAALLEWLVLAAKSATWLAPAARATRPAATRAAPVAASPALVAGPAVVGWRDRVPKRPVG